MSRASNPRGPEFARRLTAQERAILDRVLSARHMVPTPTRPGRWARSGLPTVVAAGVATIVLLMVGGLAALRTAGSSPVEHMPASPTEPASVVLSRLATAAAGQLATDDSPLTRRWLHLVLYAEPEAGVCKGMAVAVTWSVVRPAPLPDPQAWSLAVERWRPADDDLRAEGCDPARTALSSVDLPPKAYTMPADKLRLGGLPLSLQQIAGNDERLIGRTAVVEIDATADGVRRALDAEPDEWWPRWVQLMVSVHTTRDQRVAALTTAAARPDAQTVAGPTVDLAGRPGVTIRVPHGAGAVADLTFDEATGTLLQYRVMADGDGRSEVVYATLGAGPPPGRR